MRLHKATNHPGLIWWITPYKKGKNFNSEWKWNVSELVLAWDSIKEEITPVCSIEEVFNEPVFKNYAFIDCHVVCLLLMKGYITGPLVGFYFYVAQYTATHEYVQTLKEGNKKFDF